MRTRMSEGQTRGDSFFECTLRIHIYIYLYTHARQADAAASSAHFAKYGRECAASAPNAIKTRREAAREKREREREGT